MRIISPTNPVHAPETPSQALQPLELKNGTIQFPDRPPGHAASSVRARKVLCPTEEGYAERLELEQDNGEFAVYSILPMRRVRSV